MAFTCFLVTLPQKTFTVMHCPVFEHGDTLSFAFLVCIILYTDVKQFRGSVFTFVRYITSESLKAVKGFIFSIIIFNVYVQLGMKNVLKPRGQNK